MNCAPAIMNIFALFAILAPFVIVMSTADTSLLDDMQRADALYAKLRRSGGQFFPLIAFIGISLSLCTGASPAAARDRVLRNIGAASSLIPSRVLRLTAPVLNTTGGQSRHVCSRGHLLTRFMSRALCIPVEVPLVGGAAAWRAG